RRSEAIADWKSNPQSAIMFGPIKKHSRLGQWNGRRRSSRSSEPVFTRLWQRPVLLRLATVLSTMVLVTLLAYRWGTPSPYRVGQVFPRDVRSRVSFEVSNLSQTEQAREEAEEKAGSDPVERARARRAVLP